MIRKKERACVIIGGFVFLMFSAALTFYALRNSISYFYMPSEIDKATIQSGQKIRIGGLVEQGTLVRESIARVIFSLKDAKKSIKVVYTGGLLPDLFRENQGVVANGYFKPDGVFIAHEILAKHDENYIPKDIKKKT